MLATLIQRYDKNHLIFDPVQDGETKRNFTGCQVPPFYDSTIYQFIKPFMDNKMSIFEEYGAFNPCPAKRIKPSLKLLIFSQSDGLI